MRPYGYEASFGITEAEAVVIDCIQIVAANYWSRTTVDTTGSPIASVSSGKASMFQSTTAMLWAFNANVNVRLARVFPTLLRHPWIRHAISWVHIPSRGCSLPLLVSLHPCRDPEPLGTNNRNLHWPLDCIPLGHQASRNHGSSFYVWHHRFFDHTTEFCDEDVVWRSLGASIAHLNALGIQLKRHNPPPVPGARRQSTTISYCYIQLARPQEGERQWPSRTLTILRQPCCSYMPWRIQAHPP